MCVKVLRVTHLSLLLLFTDDSLECFNRCVSRRDDLCKVPERHVSHKRLKAPKVKLLSK